MEIVVETELNDAQDDFYWCESFAALFVGGVGGGKTFVGARKARDKALTNPETLGLITSNTNAQLNQSTLPEFWQSLTEIGLVEGVDYVVNKQPLERWNITSRFKRHQGIITLFNGAQIVMRSLHNWIPLLGLTLGWVWIDEARDAEKDAFDKAIIERLRCKDAAFHQVFITTTPNGFDWLYDYFEVEPNKPDKEYLKESRQYFRAPTKDNVKHVGEQYIKNITDTIDERLAKQQLEGLWIDVFSGKAYYAFDRKIHVVKEEMKIDRARPIMLCCDFNVSPMAWMVAQIKRYSGDSVYQDEVICFIDEIEVDNTTTQECVTEYLSRFEEYGFRSEKELANSTIVYGDAAGKNRSTTGSAATRSDYEIMKSRGLDNQVIPGANPLQVNRVASVNAKLMNANGKIGTQMNKCCTGYKTDSERVSFKKNTRQLDKSDPALTHFTDGGGYAIHKLWPVDRGKFKSVNTAGY